MNGGDDSHGGYPFHLCQTPTAIVANEDSHLAEGYALSTGKLLQVFRKIIMSSSSGSHSPKRITDVSGIVVCSSAGSENPRRITDVSGIVVSSSLG